MVIQADHRIAIARLQLKKRLGKIQEASAAKKAA